MLSGPTLIWIHAEITLTHTYTHPPPSPSSQSASVRVNEGCRFSETHLLLCLLCPQSIITLYLAATKAPPDNWCMFEQWVGWEYSDCEEIWRVNCLFFIFLSKNKHLQQAPNDQDKHFLALSNTGFEKCYGIFRLGPSVRTDLTYLLIIYLLRDIWKVIRMSINGRICSKSSIICLLHGVNLHIFCNYFEHQISPQLHNNQF